MKLSLSRRVEQTSSSAVGQKASATMRLWPASILSSLLVLIIVVGGATISKAQTPLARFVAPTNGQTGVSISDSITIITRWRVDTSCLLPPGDSVANDTTYGHDTELTNVLVLPKYVFDSIADSLWWAMSPVQSVDLVNDTTLSIHMGTMYSGTNYKVVIQNLKVIDSSGDTLTVPDTISLNFQTAYGTQEILGSTVLDSSGLMRCGDTLRVYFNQPLDSANTPSGPLFEIHALNATNDFPASDTDTTVHYMYTDSLVPSTSWLDPTNPSIVCVKGTELQPGQNYLFEEWPSRLTGDSSQDAYYTLNVKGSYEVQITQSGIVGDSSYPDQGMFEGQPAVLYPGDTGMWIAPAIADSFAFSHWSCPGTDIDGSTNDTLRVTEECSTLQDLNVTAIYLPLPFDSVSIDSLSATNSDSDSVAVYYENGNLIGITGSPTGYPVRLNTVIVVVAHPGPGYIFDHWNSNYSSINGSGQIAVPIKISGPIWLTPVFAGGAGDGCDLGGQVTTTDWVAPSDYLDLNGTQEAWITAPSDLAHGIFPDNKDYYYSWPPGDDPCPATPPSGPVTLHINPHYYGGSWYMQDANYYDVGLWNYYIDNHPQRTPPPIEDLNDEGNTKTVTETYTDRPRTVVYDVHRYNVQLQVRIEMNSQHYGPPDDDGLVTHAPTNETGDVSVFLTANQQPHSETYIKYSQTHPYKEYDLTYAAGVSISDMIAETSERYQFIDWVTMTSTDGGAHWFASSDGGQTWTAPENVSEDPDWGGTEIHGDKTIILAIAKFKEKFTLLTAAVEQDPTYLASPTTTAYWVRGAGSDDRIGPTVTQWTNPERETWLNSDYTFGGKPTIALTFTFSDTLDPSTLWNHLNYTEEQGRIDGLQSEVFLLDGAAPYTLDNNEGPNYTLVDNPDGTSTLTWYVCSETSFKVWNWPFGWITVHEPITPEKLEKYGIQLTNGLESIHYVPLSNPQTLQGQTVNPDVLWTATNTQIASDFDNSTYWAVYIFGKFVGWVDVHPNHGADPYLVTSGSYNDLAGASGVKPGTGQSAHSSDYGVYAGNSHDFNTTVVNISRPRDVSTIAGTITTMNKQGGDIYNALDGGLGAIKKAADANASKLLAALLAPPKTGIPVADIASTVVAAVLGLSGTSLFSSPDEHMGTVVWTGNKENWWGGRSMSLTKSSTGGSYGHDNMGTTTNTITVTLQ